MNGTGVWRRSHLTEWVVGAAALPLVWLLVVEWVGGSKQTRGLTEKMSPCSASLSPPTHHCSHLTAVGGSDNISRDQTHIFCLRVQRWVKWEDVTRQNCDRILPKFKLCITARWIHSCSIILVFSSRAEKTNTDDIVDVFALRETLYLSSEGHQSIGSHQAATQNNHTPNCSPLSRSATGAVEEEEERRMLLLRGPSMVAAELVQIWTDIPLVTRPQQGWHLLSAAASDFLFSSPTLCLAFICHHFFVGSSCLKRIMWQN